MGTDGVSPEEPAAVRPVLGRRAIVTSAALIAASLVCLGFGAGFGDSRVPGAAEDELAQLDDRIRQVETHARALPDAATVDRGLAAAHVAAERIARIQNDARQLAPLATAGTLEAQALDPTRRALTPYFGRVAETSGEGGKGDAWVTGPWYLSRADVTAPEGIGIPSSFDSNFRWQAHQPLVIGENGLIPVVWVAIETTGSTEATGVEPRVLAQVSAEYDLVRQTFHHPRREYTVTGNALGVGA